MTEREIKNFVYISIAVGKNPAYVQGGGGNTSVKLDNNRMAIKASGGCLKDITQTNGYSIVDCQAIRNYLVSPDQDENIFTKKIKSFVVETDNRPSIETGFHVLLGKFIIHTHSVYTNLLTCSKEGEEIAQKLFTNSLWVKYASPGRELTLAVQKKLKALKQVPNIIFLENHGVIVNQDNSKEVLKIHEKLNQKICDYLNLPVNVFDVTDTCVDLEFVKNHVIFPDQVVYTLAGDEILQTQAAKETLAAYKFIINQLKEKGLNPNFLSNEKANILLNMESEKYRQKIMKKTN